MTHPTGATHGVAAVLLSLHVIAAIVLIGPITVAASLFPRYARSELEAPGGRVTPALHRITSVYAVAALTVPVFGIGTAATLHALGQTWLIVSMVLTGVAALILALVVVPIQREVMVLLRDRAVPEPQARLRALLARLGAFTGLFGLTWAAVVVLMILRPGSTTGV